MATPECDEMLSCFKGGVSRAQYIAYLRRRAPIEELERKACKAKRRGKRWTQEDLDVAIAKAHQLLDSIQFD
jgi:hypothetical protein